MDSSSSTPRNFNTTSHYYPPSNGGALSGRRSPSLRASTLPRNNNLVPVAANNNGVHVDTGSSSKNSNLIQIGLDTSSAFVRKSPTPMLKSQNGHNNNGNGNHMMQRNGSQLSLLSDRGGNQMPGAVHLNGKFNLDLGIPHNNLIDAPHPLHAVSARTTNQNSNMPMKLEDLDDLLKYADEQNTVNGDEMKTAKVGSSTSIGHCSSGYQSIATQSQSSTSPVDLASGVNAPNGGDFPSNSMKTRRALGQHISAGSKYANGKYTSNGNNNNNNNNSSALNGALAFKNPLYQLQNAIGSNGTSIAVNNNIVAGNVKARRQHYSQLHSRTSQQSSSLTPSSSDERLSQSNTLDDSNGNNVNGLIGNLNGTLTSSSDKEYSLNDDCNSGTLNGTNSMTKRLTGSNNRMPRTNPLMQVNLINLALFG